jgi:hypothetical protein
VSIATFHVPGIQRESEERLNRLLAAKPGVRDVEACSQTKRVRLIYDERQTRLDDLKDAVASAGYQVVAVY